MATDVLLDHLEKTFAEAYRKEIDQEENIWRTLPFFAATLALQLTAVAQFHDWLIASAGRTFVIAVVFLGLAALATVAALVFVALSVWPADFRYVASEPKFLEYAERVRAGAQPAPDADEIALRTVKAALLQQYALAADNNRHINQRRGRWRTLGGLATLGSVLIVLVLLALAVVISAHGYGHKSSSVGHPSVDNARNGVARSTHPEFSGATPHGGHPQRVVAQPGH